MNEKKNNDERNGRRALILGVGRTGREFLKRLGEGWRISLVDKSQDSVDKALSLFPNVEETFIEDASSPVVLEKAGVKDFDYVLALTGDDLANMTAGETAVDKGAMHVSVLIREERDTSALDKKGVRIIESGVITAKTILHYLQDPRMTISPLSSGNGAVFEVDAADHFRVVGKRASYFSGADRRLAAVFRKDELMFPTPKTVINEDDRLVIVGDPEIFNTVCDLLECGQPHFPMAYGQGLLLALSRDEDNDHNIVLNEGLYLAQNIQVRQVTVLCPGEDCSIEPNIKQWPQNVNVRVKSLDESMLQGVRLLLEEGSFGLVVVPTTGSSIFKRLGKSPILKLAHDTQTPVLRVGATFPYQRILVPFNLTKTAESAFDTAVDISRQLDADVAAVVVEEPGIVSGEEEGKFTKDALKRVRELSHIHKIQVQEIIKRGNPVKQISEVTKDFDLLVMGTSNKDTGLFSPNVGGLLVDKAECSVLVLAR